jgi:hypothetical protein
MKKILTLFTLAILTQSCSTKNVDGFYKGYETPSYQITNKIDGFEFRTYQPFLVAEVEVEGDRKEAAKEGFMTLARFIFGKNKVGEKVAMTSPVTQEEASEKIAMTSTVFQNQNGDKKWLVQFSMPKKYNIKTLPQPEDQRIKFKITKDKKVVAITFSSLWSDNRINEEKEKLLAFAKAQNLKILSLPIITYYDDPFTFPWNRRNEILLEIK